MNQFKGYLKLFGVFLMLALTQLLGTGCKDSHHKEFDDVPKEKTDDRARTDNNEKHRHTANESETKVLRSDELRLIVNNEGNDGLKRIPVRDIGSLRKVLNDSNAIQLDAARKIGIEPIADIRGAYRTKRPVIKIESCGDYEVDDLKHSFPFLVPEAAKLLGDIGKAFNDSLEARGGDGYRIKVTSLLRTPHTVKKLRRVNINATETSTHQFATTFDISYTKFHKYGSGQEIHDGDLKNLLAEILNNMRADGRCYVKFERQTSCFHITCR